MKRTLTLRTCLVVFCLALAARAEEKPVERLLPPSTIGYMEISSPKALLQYLDHPLVKKLQASDPYKQATGTPQYQQFAAQLAQLEKELGTGWRTSLEAATGGGIYLAVDPATRGVAVLLKSSDPASHAKIRDAVLSRIRQFAADMGQPDPVQVADYRGITGYSVGNGACMAVAGPWLVFTNSKPLGRGIIDRYLDANLPSLADDAEFAAARGKAAKGLAGWGFVKIKMMRDVGLLLGLFPARSGNPAGELLVGGVLGVLGDAPYGTLELRAEAGELNVAVLLPHNPERYPATRKFFFSPAGEPSLTGTLTPKETVLSISAYRDVAAMWKAAPDLFDENVATNLAQVDSQLSNFFGGKSFSGDILGNLGPRWQFIAARAKFDPALAPVPALKLPAMALVVQVRDAKRMQPHLKIAFQTLVSIVNIQAGMAGNPTFLLSNEQRGDVAVMHAAYLAMTDEKGRTDAGIHYNFEPTMVLVGDRAIVASSKSLAEELLKLAQQEKGPGLADNTLVRLDGAAGLAALRDNREQLIAQNMIQQGHDRAAAEKAVDFFFDALQLVRGVEFRLTPEPGLLKIELGVKIGEK